jgi:hypothetical protein
MKNKIKTFPESAQERTSNQVEKVTGRINIYTSPSFFFLGRRHSRMRKSVSELQDIKRADAGFPIEPFGMTSISVLWIPFHS